MGVGCSSVYRTRKDEDFSTITDVLIMKMKNKRLEDRDYGKNDL